MRTPVGFSPAATSWSACFFAFSWMFGSSTCWSVGCAVFLRLLSPDLGMFGNRHRSLLPCSRRLDQASCRLEYRLSRTHRSQALSCQALRLPWLSIEQDVRGLQERPSFWRKGSMQGKLTRNDVWRTYVAQALKAPFSLAAAFNPSPPNTKANAATVTVQDEANSGLSHLSSAMHH